MLEVGCVVPINVSAALDINPRNDAILLVVFDGSIPKNAKKSERLAKLNELHAKDPSRISDYLSGALTALSEPVPAALPDQPPLLPSLTAAATATTGGSTSCGATSEMAYWLYFCCARAVKDHVYPVDALQLSYLVLDVMDEVKMILAMTLMNWKTLGASLYSSTHLERCQRKGILNLFLSWRRSCKNCLTIWNSIGKG